MLKPLILCFSFVVLAVGAFIAPRQALALEAAVLEPLGSGDGDEISNAIRSLVASTDPRAAQVLQALADGRLARAGTRLIVLNGTSATDALSGEAVRPVPEQSDEITLNNRLRRELGVALAALALSDKDPEVRLEAAAKIAEEGDESVLAPVRRALASETGAPIRAALGMFVATQDLKSTDPALRLQAARALGDSSAANVRPLLLGVLERAADGTYAEGNAEVRAAAERSLRAVDSRLAWGERLGLLFTGLSLGSILLLAALGLAITYGLMGVINMAHGELIMVGAYATYAVQSLFRQHLPHAFDFYLVVAVPVAFSVAALVGMALERMVIRFLYGRPLETLLATWGISLMLMQAVRSLFGAQNVQVENPRFMSGGIGILSNVVLPWNRVYIIVFALLVLAGMAVLLARTRLGLFVRGVTQNRGMAACVGVPTARIDTLAFGLGSGIAGLAGCALSQVGNVGPDLGQSYIVDSFLVVVLGGVGQLIGTVYAALGLGFADKLLESWSGAVLAKIILLAFIVVFIQKRPQGLFALKGRSVEA
jgi:urea transport system permease protein